MGACCSKIDRRNECGICHGALHPCLEQWKTQNVCQFCQLSGVASHVQCCVYDACQNSASSTPRYGTKGFLQGASQHESRCSYRVADAYKAERHHGLCIGCRPTDNDDMTYLDEEQRDHSIQQNLSRSDQSSKCGLPQGHYDTRKDILGQQHASRHDLGIEDDFPTKHEHCIQGKHHATEQDFLLMDTHQTVFEPDDEMLPSQALASSSREGQDVIMLSNIAACEFLSTSMRFARSVSIDDSDGIKLEVRYKHMLPHDVQRSTINCASVQDCSVLKRTRSSESLLGEDMEANRSIRRRKSFQGDSRYERREVITSEINNVDVDIDVDVDDGDDGFHDITVGVSISSLFSGPGCMINTLLEDSKQCQSVFPGDRSHVNLPINMTLSMQDGLNYVTRHVGSLSASNVPELNQPVYLLSEENMQFISKEEREWEVRAEAMGVEDKINSRAQALSVVSTGDAILFSGANSDEFHLIPSMFVQHPKSPVLSPSKSLSPARIMSRKSNEQEPEKSALSVEDIILLLENDELNEDDFFSLLIDSCTRSSPSSSPSSSTEASMIWSSPLSSASPSSTLSASASSSTSMPCLPSSTSILQLPGSPPTASSLSLPYALSLPVSCKMSPHTSFEFKVKSCSSTPSTPVFSPIRSRSKRNMTQLKPNVLTAGEMAEIWGAL